MREQLAHLIGRPARITFDVTCVWCGEPTKVANGARYSVTPDRPGGNRIERAAMLILKCTSPSCARHTELVMNVTRSDVREPKDNGKDKARERAHA